MKTTLDLPDDLYRQAKTKAAHEGRKMKDLVTEGLNLVLGLPGGTATGPSLATAAHQPKADEDAQKKALRALEEIRHCPPSPPERTRELIAEAARLRHEGWNQGDLGR